jgi:outer membrane receptor for ferrienterochelin and colicin
VNFSGFKREDVYLTLGESSKQDIVMTNKPAEMTAVVVTTTRSSQSKGGVETNISREKVANLPTVGRNITDLLRTVPQAKLDRRNEGAIAIAGQNNRYNAFYIDGALNNDVFGLAASGTNGGQANIPPISLDAIDQIQVSISPYDASLSGFTGGGINAVTRSGTNEFSGSAYYLFRNENLSGKTPSGEKSDAVKLPEFSDKTTGFRFGGPIIKSKLFFFLNGEIVRFNRPQVFDVSKYAGSTNLAGLNALRDTLRIKYGYEAGGFENNPETVEANRVLAKIDWNINAVHKASFTYRYNDGTRYNTSSSSASTINFFNDGYVFPTTSNTYTGELRSNFTNGKSNRLLLTFADVKDDRAPIGSPFPRVAINDGTNGRIIFGPDNSSTINLLTQKNYNLFDVFKFTVGRHSLSVGTDDELNDAYNAFIQNTFGNYTYGSVADFYNNAKPVSYSVGYPLIDNKQDETTAAAAKFKTMRLGFFVNDELRPTENLTLNFAIRADKFAFITTPATDTFTNNTALPKFMQYYNLEGARSGIKPNVPVSISPRFGLTYKIPQQNLVIRFGAGLFTGRVPLVWPGAIFNSNGLNQGSFTASSSQNAAALNTIRFRSDPNGQWRASDVGIALSKGPLNLITEEFRLPKVFRTSLGFDKALGAGWTFTGEAIFTKNINEIYYTNINILPPSGSSLGLGTRNVYPAPNTIPITASGGNPYDNAILMSNAKSKGYSYNFTATLDKRFTRGFAFNLNYSYGESVVLHEQTSSVNFSQWQFMESVNGRNYLQRSRSDFSPGHRIVAFASKKFTYLQKRLATTLSLVYTGESGAPISYVYGNNSPIRDVANATVSNDLVYIPTAGELQGMTFLSNTVTATGITYTPQQQKDALELYIQNNDYMNTHRGQFAERNGDRLKFTHILDMRIAQDFNVKIGSKNVQFQVTYDVFNFTNMLNRNWGRTYFLSNDQLAVISFAGYVSATNLTPQYRFTPTLAQPQTDANISTSTAPSFSPRWSSQLGFRINF